MLFNFVICLVLRTQWYDKGIFSMSILSGGLLFFIIGVTIGVRKILKNHLLVNYLENLGIEVKAEFLSYSILSTILE